MIDNVIEGAFYVANQLYGVEFTERTDIPTYHPEVRTFVVTDVDGSHLGVFMTDYYPRPGKRGGAWSSRIRGQWVEDGGQVRPIVLNVGNFSRPAGDAPALISLEEVHTLFHELGHGLQSLLSNIQYRGSAGVTRDFVELPSQIMENWLLEPEVLKVYAKHYETGEVIPDELVAKIQAAEQFNQGFTSVEYLAACFLDMDWHTLEEPAGVDVTGFEKKPRRDRPDTGNPGPLSQYLLQPHHRWLLGRLLQLHLERGPRCRRLPGVQGDQPLRPGNRLGLPHQHSGNGRIRGSRGALPALPRPCAKRRAPAAEKRLQIGRDSAGRLGGRPLFCRQITRPVSRPRFFVGRKN